MDFNLPLCRINLEKEDYLEKVKKFYNKNKQNIITPYTKEVEQKYNLQIRCLDWDEKEGLRNINIFSGGLDLEIDQMRYVFHNINPESKCEKATFEIAKKYLEELIKEN
ncbi:MAG: hypothetical protein Q8O84_03905 [Nanoarchaeota archaeon]|nr:hypothetical protein [Nanoarchaeota archaeon]